MPSLTEIAEETDAHATELEAEFRQLALLLFALELALIMRAIARAQTDADVVSVLRAATISYRAPNGMFRRRWEDSFGELLRDIAAQDARRALPVVATPRAQLARIGAASAPRAVFRAIEIQAAELAASVTQVSALKLEAAASAIVREISDRRVSAPPAPPTPPGPRLFQDQRLETLVPLVGRNAAEEIMRAVRAGREAGQSIPKVAHGLTEQVLATKVSKVRATRIARTESIGLVNAVEYERAAATGVLREKRWISQRDARVRETHVLCDRQSWIPIAERYSNGLMYPGERPAPASEIISCRCGQAFRA